MPPVPSPCGNREVAVIKLIDRTPYANYEKSIEKLSDQNSPIENNQSFVDEINSHVVSDQG